MMKYFVPKNTDLEIVTDLHILRAHKYKNWVLECVSMYVCLGNARTVGEILFISGIRVYPP
jgi:hypothetical protein